MIRLILTVELFFAFPWICFAIGMQSFWILGAAFVGSMIGVLVLLVTSKKRLIHHLKATRLLENDPFVRTAKKNLRQKGRENFRYSFWVFSSPKEEYWLWSEGQSEITFFLSQGLLLNAQENQFVEMLLAHQNDQNLKPAQYRHALLLWWNALKGPSSRFRHWIISFWLYPLEASLKKSS